MKLTLLSLGLILTLIGGIAFMHTTKSTKSEQSLRGDHEATDVFVLQSSSESDSTELNQLYEQWKSDFKGTSSLINGMLGESESQELNRFLNFKENVKLISEHNKEFKQGTHTYSMKINQFSHLSAQEFKEMVLTDLSYNNDNEAPREKKYREDQEIQTTQSPMLLASGDPTPFWKMASNLYYEAYKSAWRTSEESSRPKQIDWSNKLGLHKNQGMCGSCFSFTTTAAIQAVMGVKEPLSVQEILDCDSRNNGCKGGIPQKVFSYVMYNGIGFDSQYPYQTRQNEECRVDFNNKKRVKIADFYDVKSSVAALETALQYGPVVTAIDASTLQGYNKGLFQSVKCATSRDQANHAVLIVGYTEESFIVRNSWGQTWGENGNFRVPKIGGSIGICGLYNDMTYPTKE